MSSLQRILAASDLSPRAARAVSRALVLATQQQARLSVLHVVAEGSLWKSLLRPIGRTPKRPDEYLMRKARAALHQQVASVAVQQERALRRENFECR